MDDATTNLDDESWTNPWDVAQGHRGILDGDFVVMQYAWAPNWKPNVIGRHTYNLYIRRSFDGGKTYTTTPASLNGTDPDGTAVGADAPLVVADGTTACEIYRVPVDGDVGEPGVTVKLPAECTTYAAGAFEPARNLSLVNTKLPLPTEMKYDGSGLYQFGQIEDVNRPPAYYKVDAAAFEMAFNVQLAAGYKPLVDEMNSLQFTGLYQNNNFSGDEAKLGAEYGYNSMFFVRAGYHRSPGI